MRLSDPFTVAGPSKRNCKGVQAGKFRTKRTLKGITVCEREEKFNAFLNQDLLRANIKLSGIWVLLIIPP